MGKRNIQDLAYGGKYHDQGWNPNLNKEADVLNCRANCTCATIQECLIEGYPLPQETIHNASSWHKYLTHGWKCIPYNVDSVKRGDIIEWEEKCHVAIVDKVDDGIVFLHCSWYTGEHGKSVYGGKWDTRTSFSTMKEVSDFMVANYPYRFYHYVTLQDESNGVGGAPEYILVNPLNMVHPTAQDKSKDQIQVTTDCQNIRNNNGSIIGVADSGYYDVFDQKEDSDYIWYKVGNDSYIAGVKGRVLFIPKEVTIDWESRYVELEKEYNALKDNVLEIHKLSDI